MNEPFLLYYAKILEEPLCHDNNAMKAVLFKSLFE